jgi:hypothetical protein
VGRSIYKEDNCVKEVKVLAMAVLVEDAYKLSSKDQRLREPHYSLPLFVCDGRNQLLIQAISEPRLESECINIGVVNKMNLVYQWGYKSLEHSLDNVQEKYRE